MSTSSNQWLLSSAATASTRWWVRELYCPTMYVCFNTVYLNHQQKPRVGWCVPFNFKPSWFTWALLMTYTKVTLKSNNDRVSPCFIPFSVGKHIRQRSVYSDCAWGCIQTHFISILDSSGYPAQSIIQDLPRNWIIGFLEVYKQRMHCFTASLGRTNVENVPDILTCTICRPTFGNADSRLFLFSAQCLNTESILKGFQCYPCVQTLSQVPTIP
jgi:hypothetical protein